MNILNVAKKLVQETNSYRYALSYFKGLGNEHVFLGVIDDTLEATYGEDDAQEALEKVESAFRQDRSLDTLALLFRTRGYKPGHKRSMSLLLPARLIDNQIAFKPAPAAMISSHDFIPGSDESEEEFVKILTEKANAFVISVDQPELTSVSLQVILQAMTKARIVKTGQLKV